MGEGVLTAVADAVGTPVYVYDAAVIRARYEALVQALGNIPHRVHYSVKANGSLAVLGVLRSLGVGVDIVSGGELERVLRAGFRAGDVVFSGVGKSPDELRRALDEGVGLLNVESADELEAVTGLARESGRRARVGIRVNPEVTTETHPYTQTGDRGMKFGVPLDEVGAMARRPARDACLQLVSLGMHIGSQILDASRYREGADKLIALVGQVRDTGIDTLETVDVGGGLGIRYTTEEPLDLDTFAGAVRPVWEETGLTLTLEPGRYLVGNAGVLLTRCLYRKHTGGSDFVIVDAGMTDLIRPTLYHAVHEIDVVTTAAEGAGAGAGSGRVHVVGPICETGDFLGLDRPLGAVASGALLAVHDVGAYGFAMSSNYNSRPRAAEVLVDGDRWAVIREREAVDDLMRGERTLGDVSWREGGRGKGEA